MGYDDKSGMMGKNTKGWFMCTESKVLTDSRSLSEAVGQI